MIRIAAVRHVAIALLLISCSACGSCRTDKPNADASALASASAFASPSASTSAFASASASPTDPNARWDLVAKRKPTNRPLFIAEVGTRVVVGETSPIAWADGAGPLVAAPKIEADYTSGVAGTHPSAVWVATDKRLHQLVGEGWRDVGPLPPRFRMMVPFGDRGAVMVSSVIEGSSMPSILPDERPATTLKALVAEG